METDDPEIGGHEDSEDVREVYQGGTEDSWHSEKERQTRNNKNSERNNAETHRKDNMADKDSRESNDRKEKIWNLKDLSESEYNEKKQKLFKYAREKNRQ